MYYNGDEVTQDNIMAHVWFTLAAANGHENAATALDVIAERLTATDVYAAREIAMDCVEQNYENCSR